MVHMNKNDIMRKIKLDGEILSKKIGYLTENETRFEVCRVARG